MGGDDDNVGMTWWYCDAPLLVNSHKQPLLDKGNIVRVDGDDDDDDVYDDADDDDVISIFLMFSNVF